MAATSPPSASLEDRAELASTAPATDAASELQHASPLEPIIPGWMLPLDIYPPFCSPLLWDDVEKREIYVLHERMGHSDIVAPTRTVLYSTLTPPGLFMAVDHGAYGEPPHTAGEPFNPEAVWPRYDPTWLRIDVEDINDESHYRKQPPPFEGAHNFILEIQAQELFRRQSNVHHNMPMYLGCEVDCGWVVRVVFRRYPRTLRDAVESGERIDIPGVMAQLEDVVRYLHSLGVAHNDINPGNIMLTDDLTPILIDYDTCLPAGAPLVDKRGTYGFNENDSWTTSAFANDISGLAAVAGYLRTTVCTL